MICLVGIVEKKASGALPTTGWSCGWKPALSGGACVPQIDGDAFDLNGWTAAELSDTEDGIRLMCVDCSLERINGSFKFGRDFAFDDICACDRIVQSADGFPGGIDGFPRRTE